MRGKEASRKLRGTLKGITPAYAGKSQCNSSCTAGKWDHPRVCGEKPRQDSVGALEGRITPACAGKSLFLTRRGFSKWDHPRVCGEKYLRIAVFVLLMGSPPRMRGKVCGYFVVCRYLRITPAYAGKSLRKTPPPARQRDHPRVCGEKRSLETAATFPYGSPPRMRGKGNPSPISHSQKRITPAYAGKSPG